MIELNTIYNEDCLETMKRMPDNYIDLILTDPPYGISADSKMAKQAGTKYGKALAAKKDYGVTDWDKSIPGKEIFEQIFRVSKKQVIFGGNYFTEHLPPSANWIVWDKRVEDKYNNNFADCELVWASGGGAARIIRYLWSGFLQGDMKNKEKRDHPTQKPLPVIKKLVEMFSTEGELIYDPFMGSGTTAKACIDLNRNYIGSELSKEYCDIAEERLKQGVLL